MSNTFLEIIGLVAAGLTTIAYVPQVYKAWKSKSVKDLSWPMLLLFSAGLALWIVYGVMEGDVPIIVANGCTLLLTLALVYFKIKFKD